MTSADQYRASSRPSSGPRLLLLLTQELRHLAQSYAPAAVRVRRPIACAQRCERDPNALSGWSAQISAKSGSVHRASRANYQVRSWRGGSLATSAARHVRARAKRTCRRHSPCFQPWPGTHPRSGGIPQISRVKELSRVALLTRQLRVAPQRRTARWPEVSPSHQRR